MLVGYARTSTLDQLAGFEAQERELKAAGCEKIFKEQTSSIGQRAQFEQALAFTREGDVLVVTKLDRLARSISDLCSIVSQLDKRGIAIRILGLNIDTLSPTGKLMLNLLGSIGQFEREIMLERQREGIAKAKSEGKYKGRAPTARRQSPQVHFLANEGHTREQIAVQVGISVASVYRILKDGKSNGQ